MFPLILFVEILNHCKQGKIKKIYGGVKLVESEFGESSMGERMINHLEEKKMIAQVCSE